MNESRASTSPLDAVLFARHDAFLAERPPGADEDVHMLQAVVDHVIQRCTEPGDLILDPFAGFGTTLQRAVALARQAIGVELLPERVRAIQQRVPAAEVMEGDARGLMSVLQNVRGHDRQTEITVILTSPPYMTREHHDADPLTAYVENDGDYHRYQAELGLVAAQCARLVVPGGYVVWNVADIHHMGHTTRLIADCYQTLKQHLTPVGITEIMWDHYPHDLVRDALLVFQRKIVPGLAEVGLKAAR